MSQAFVKISLGPELKDVEFHGRPQSVHLIGTLDDDKASTIIDELYQLRNAGQSIIPVYVNCQGGDINLMEAIITAMNVLKQGSNVTLVTIGIGEVKSAAVDIVASGSPGYRFAAPGTTFMMHAPVMPDIVGCNVLGNESVTQHYCADHTRQCERMDQICNKEPGFFHKTMQSCDIYCDAQTACDKFGIIDTVGCPELNVAVRVDYELIHSRKRRR